MAKYIITPWRQQTDLLEVRSQLYRLNQDQTDLRRHAVDRVMAWKLRGHLPHAVESTALLIDAVLHHRVTGNSIFSVRAVYSAAFTRFVTGFCDIGRNRERSLEPSSMLDIAKQIGMPVEFVGLRHEATHEELPGVQRLVRATDEALKWLWNVYWSRLEDSKTTNFSSEGSPEKIRLDSRKFLREFRAAKIEALRSPQNNSVEVVNNACSASIQLLGKSAEPARIFTDELVQDGLLWPSKRELGSSMDGAYLLWDDFLLQLASVQQKFLDAMVSSMLNALVETGSATTRKGAQREAVVLWLLHLIDPATKWSSIGAECVATLRKDMLQWCCLHTGEWSQLLGHKVLEDADASTVAQWNDIFEASQVTKSPDEEDASTEQSTFLAGDARDIKMQEPSYLSAEGLGWYRASRPLNKPIGVV